MCCNYWGRFGGAVIYVMETMVADSCNHLRNLDCLFRSHSVFEVELPSQLDVGSISLWSWLSCCPIYSCFSQLSVGILV